MTTLKFSVDLETIPLKNVYVLELSLSKNIYMLPLKHEPIIFPENTETDYIIRLIKTCDKVLEVFEEEQTNNNCVDPDTMLDISSFYDCGEEYNIDLSALGNFLHDDWQGLDLPFNEYNMYYYDKNGYKYFVRLEKI